MECSFEAKGRYPNGAYWYSKCVNKADIWTTNDPCFGLCFGCAYKQLKAENEQYKDFIEKHFKHKHDHEYYHDDCGLCQIEKAEYAKTKQILKGKQDEC